MKDVVAVIMGGGQGSRLFPLTRDRAKPAVPVAGRVRLIDIPVSNCINSGIQQIFVLTQFQSASLNRHLYQTYHFGTLSDAGVHLLAAEQTMTNRDWFQGTADAVRRSLRHILTPRTRKVIILAGDHLYRMNYAAFVQRHDQAKADVTLSACPVDEEAARGFGLMHVNDQGLITRFAEKPTGGALEAMRVDPNKPIGGHAPGAPFLASMGIYVFAPEVLLELLKSHPDKHDFGKEIIPAALDEYRMAAHFFKGYWEDIGTIAAFYRANVNLTKRGEYSLYDPDFPLFTRPRYLSPSRVNEARIEQSLIAEGSIIGRCSITGSVVGIRSRIHDGCELDGALVMGHDLYETETERAAALARGRPELGIGEGTIIRRAIIDKNTRIGRNVRIINEENVQDADGLNYYIRDGIVIIARDAVVPDDTVI